MTSDLESSVKGVYVNANPWNGNFGMVTAAVVKVRVVVVGGCSGRRVGSGSHGGGADDAGGAGRLLHRQTGG